MIQWLKRLFSKDPPTVEIKTLVWGVIEGPYYAHEVCPDEPLDDDLCLLVCKVEENGKVFDSEVWFDCFDSAYEFKRYFDTNIEPLEVTHGG